MTEKIKQRIYITMIILGTLLLIIGITGCSKTNNEMMEKSCREKCLQANMSYAGHQIYDTETLKTIKCACIGYIYR